MIRFRRIIAPLMIAAITAAALSGCLQAPGSAREPVAAVNSSPAGSPMSEEDFPCSIVVITGDDKVETLAYCKKTQADVAKFGFNDDVVKHLVVEYCNQAGNESKLRTLDNIYASKFGTEIDYGFGNFGWEQFKNNSYPVSFKQFSDGPRPSLYIPAFKQCGDVLTTQAKISEEFSEG